MASGEDSEMEGYPAEDKELEDELIILPVRGLSRTG